MGTESSTLPLCWSTHRLRSFMALSFLGEASAMVVNEKAADLVRASSTSRCRIGGPLTVPVVCLGCHGSLQLLGKAEGLLPDHLSVPQASVHDGGEGAQQRVIVLGVLPPCRDGQPCQDVADGLRQQGQQGRGHACAGRHKGKHPDRLSTPAGSNVPKDEQKERQTSNFSRQLDRQQVGRDPTRHR
eukprot:scaffold167515_cov24-Prasinocladus_malaysianus.AAC.1